MQVVYSLSGIDHIRILAKKIFIQHSVLTTVYILVTIKTSPIFSGFSNQTGVSFCSQGVLLSLVSLTPVVSLVRPGNINCIIVYPIEIE